VAVLVGLGQSLTMALLAFKLTSSKKTALVAGLSTCLLPFWFFHHRIALIDGLLTWLLSLTTLTAVQAVHKAHLYIQKQKGRTSIVSLLSLQQSKEVLALVWFDVALGGLFFGLSLYTKLPALLFIPPLGLIAFLPHDIKQPSSKILTAFILQLVVVGKIVGIGLFLFALLKLNPAFGQLFNRGGDFLYPWQEVFLHGQWLQTVQNIPSYTNYFGTYLTWPVLLLAVAGLFVKRYQTQSHVVFLG
jgi:4-amino-4-deoxy-L-arabinose transferase-like glycosyltransferase